MRVRGPTSETPRVYVVSPEGPGRAAAISAAVDAVRAGRLIVMPTDTVYGVASRPDMPESTRALFAAKRRPPGLNLPVLVPDTDTAWRVARPASIARALADAFWPGPLTMVLARTPLSASWELGDRGRSIAVRVPSDATALDVLEGSGPIAATSANISGHVPIAHEEALVRTFGSSVAVYLVRLVGAARGGVPSTVLDLLSDPPRIIRSGALGPQRLSKAAGTTVEVGTGEGSGARGTR